MSKLLLTLALALGVLTGGQVAQATVRSTASSPSTALVVSALAWPQMADAGKVVVSNEREFASAVERYKARGGIIVLRPGRYGELRIGQRPARARLLTVRGHGASVRVLELERARNVRLENIRIEPRGQTDARLDIRRSSRIRLSHIRVGGNRHGSARLRFASSRSVNISASEFTRCGDGRVCLLLGRVSRLVLSGNVFHDCFGCDFVRGRVGRGLVVRGNRFDRAMVGPCGYGSSCNHNDAMQIQGGRDVRIESNRFGITEMPSAGQIYLSGDLLRVTIRNNVFYGSDPTRPGVPVSSGIVVGNEVTGQLPEGVVIAHNTILSGAARPSGVANSIIVSSRYVGANRPIIVNNVIALTGSPERLCAGADMSFNVVREGMACVESDRLMDPLLDAEGFPLPGSPVIDAADPTWAPLLDILGVPRQSPDIGAYEYVAAA